jgi:acyl carrier protein
VNTLGSSRPDWPTFASAVAEAASIRVDLLSRDKRLLEDLGLDSLSLAEVVVVLVVDFKMDELADHVELTRWRNITVGELYDACCGGKILSRPEYVIRLPDQA